MLEATRHCMVVATTARPASGIRRWQSSMNGRPLRLRGAGLHEPGPAHTQAPVPAPAQASAPTEAPDAAPSQTYSSGRRASTWSVATGVVAIVAPLPLFIFGALPLQLLGGA